MNILLISCYLRDRLKYFFNNKQEYLLLDDSKWFIKSMNRSIRDRITLTNMNAYKNSQFPPVENISGIISAIQGFVAKIGMGLSGAILGWLLTKGGYVANQVQSKSALFSISLCFIWIPIVCCVLIIIIGLFYNLDGKMGKIQRSLSSRRKITQ